MRCPIVIIIAFMFTLTKGVAQINFVQNPSFEELDHQKVKFVYIAGKDC
jgi:hypothetical protein